MTVRELIDTSRASLTPLYGAGEASWLVREIFLRVKGWDQVETALRAGDEVSEFLKAKVREAVDRLKQGEPVQYIFSRAYWHGMDLYVSPAVLIPRPETSQLVDMIIDENPGSDIRVLDVCTGSGCIAIALAKGLRFPSVEAIDISTAALEVARRNAEAQKTAIHFREDDALHLGTPGEYDIIVSNPPYVMDSERAGMERNVLEHEPGIALFVPDRDPLKFYLPIARYAQEHLSEGGRLYFEANPLTVDALSEELKAIGWSDVEISLDTEGRKRFIKAIKA